jgi:thiamine pyrophosphate-dependent acetolactate synthase large subunit-like protein
MTQAVTAPPRTGAEALADAIAAEGTEVVFGVLGDGNLHWVPRLVERHGARYVAARHEAGAVAMADGYARATGRPGVCTVTQGPGLTQTGTTLTEARRARTPVVLVAGDTLRGFHDHAQDIAQEPFALATAGAYRGVGHAGTLAKDVAEAFRHARLGHGPIVLSVPLDAQTAPVAGGAPEYVPSTRGLAPLQRAAPDPERVAAVAALLAEAERPVVLAGRGAVAAGARAEVLDLAERMGAVLVTSLQAKGWFRGEPFDLGIAGGFSHDLCREVLGEADLVLAVGAHLNRFTVAHGSLFPRARLVQLDRDPDAIGHTAPVDDAIVADARSTVRELLAALPAERRTGLRTDALRERVAAFDPLAGLEFAAPGGGADPREVALVCDEELPRGRLVLMGTGHYNGLPAIHVSVDDPLDLILPWSFGAVGVALPTGIGVAVGRPDRTTVVFEGDGGLMMSLTDLDTAVRAKAPLLVVVLDDGAYGAETYMLRKHGLDEALSRFDNPDIAGVARALGMAAYEADDGAGVRAALREALPLDGPALLRVRLNPEVWHEEVFRALTG